MNKLLTRKKHSKIIAKLAFEKGIIDKKIYDNLYMEECNIYKRPKRKINMVIDLLVTIENYIIAPLIILEKPMNFQLFIMSKKLFTGLHHYLMTMARL